MQGELKKILSAFMSKWLYKNKVIDSVPEGFYGFIYRITDDKGRVYYGKKAFTHNKKRKLTKKEQVGTRKRVERIQIDSKWMDYYGSSKTLLEYISINGNKNFKREILQLCINRTDLAYYEAKILFQEEVLFRADCWNSNILGKFYKGRINKT